MKSIWGTFAAVSVCAFSYGCSSDDGGTSGVPPKNDDAGADTAAVQDANTPNGADGALPGRDAALSGDDATGPGKDAATPPGADGALPGRDANRIEDAARLDAARPGEDASVSSDSGVSPEAGGCPPGDRLDHSDCQGSGIGHRPGKEEAVTNCATCHTADLGKAAGNNCWTCHNPAATHTTIKGGKNHKLGASSTNSKDPACTSCHAVDQKGLATCTPCHM